MTGERGSVTLWMVGMVLVVFVVGGIAIDLWRGLSGHRFVASVADAAAVAAASGIDEGAWRSDGRLVLDASLVETRVAEAVAAQSGGPPVDYEVTIAADGSAATVSVATSVELTLLRLVTDDTIDVAAHATASPTLSP